MSEGVAKKSRPLAFLFIGLIDFLMPEKTQTYRIHLIHPIPGPSKASGAVEKIDCSSNTREVFCALCSKSIFPHAWPTTAA
jgi:hypothetical protein